MDRADQYAKLALIHGTSGVFLLDEQGTIQFANIQAQDFFQLPSGRLLGMNIHSLVHKAPRAEKTHSLRECPFMRFIATDRQVVRHFDIFWKKRTPFWVEFTVSPLVDSSGQKAYILYFIDAQVALRGRSSFIENEARYKLIFEMSYDPKLILNKDGIVEEANPVALAFFKRKSVLGEHVFDLFPKEGKTKFQKIYTLAKRQRISLTPLHFVFPNGDDLFIEISIFSEFLPGKILVIFRDRTAQILEQRERDQFLALVGHELKTPLAVIKAFTQLLLKLLQPSEDTKTLRYLQHIDEKADLLTGLINGMLDAIHLGSGKLPFHDEIVSFDTLVNETVFELQKTHPKEVLQVVGETQCQVCVDKHRVGQTISNLLMNAIKYSPEGSPVVVERKLDGSTVRLTITDKGIGIPKKEQPKLFNPFFRGKLAREGTAKGSGLGLYLARHVIRHYRGGIAVKSSYKKGSTFTIELPVFVETTS